MQLVSIDSFVMKEQNRSREHQPKLLELLNFALRSRHYSPRTEQTYCIWVKRFMAGGHKKRLERLHSAGTACAVHLDGVVRGLLPKLAAAGFDAVEALTPQPVGDLDVGEMRTVAGNDSVILWGGVPGIMFAPPYTWDDMEKHVVKTLGAWKGSRFILGVADQVPPDGDIGFCPRIAELVENFGNE